jgi:HlyD family secretion protein
MADTMPPPRRRPSRRRLRRRAAVGVGAVAVVAVGGGVAWAMTGSSGTQYRLATVTRATVHQTVDTTGTVSSVSSATLRFPVAGQVATVDVTIGQTVTGGQRVATLATTALQQQVEAAQASAAQARQSLAGDEASQTSTSSTSGTGSTGATAAPTARPTSSTSSARAQDAVRSAQQQLLADQHTADLDADVAAAGQDVSAETAACGPLLAATTTPATATSTPTATPTATTTPTTPTATPTTSSSSTPSSPTLQSCQQAIATVQQAQQRAQADIDRLAGDEAALDRAVTALLRTLVTAPTAPAAASPAASSASSARSASTPSGSNHVASAADLAADQARIDAADAQVTLAQQNLAQATLSSPIDGTVAAVSMAAGQQVNAGSTTATITVLGHGQKAVTTTVGLADVDLVKRGQAVQVTVDGSSSPLTGHVSQIGFLNTSGTSGSTTTYPVTILLDGSPALFDGAGAAVSIDVGTASDVLTVPASALHRVGSAVTVSRYRDGVVTTQRVTLGLQGVDRAEVTSGLAAGDQVVLADVTAPVPTNTALNGITRRFTGGGGLGGSGLGGSGLGGSGLGGK